MRGRDPRVPEHRTIARTNVEYGSAKIDGNWKRDADTDRRLIESGCLLRRIWEHEDLAEAYQRLLRLVSGRL